MSTTVADLLMRNPLLSDCLLYNILTCQARCCTANPFVRQKSTTISAMEFELLSCCTAVHRSAPVDLPRWRHESWWYQMTYFYRARLQVVERTDVHSDVVLQLHEFASMQISHQAIVCTDCCFRYPLIQHDWRLIAPFSCTACAITCA